MDAIWVTAALQNSSLQMEMPVMHDRGSMDLVASAQLLVAGEYSLQVRAWHCGALLCSC